MRVVAVVLVVLHDRQSIATRVGVDAGKIELGLHRVDHHICQPPRCSHWRLVDARTNRDILDYSLVRGVRLGWPSEVDVDVVHVVVVFRV